MPFEKHGFLGATGQGFVSKHRADFKEWFESLAELNEVANELLGHLKIDGADARHVTCASLYLRILGAFSSAYKLLELGLSQDAGTILRSQVESVIMLKACADDPSFVETYHFSGEIFRLKLVNISLAGEEGAIEVTDENRPKLLAVKEKIEGLKAEGKVKEIDVASVAKKHGLQTMYNTAYRLLSNVHTHSSSASLKQFFKFKQDGTIEAILWKPQMEDVEHLMFTLSSCLMVSFFVVSDVFKVPDEVKKELSRRAKVATDRIKEMQKTKGDTLKIDL